MRLNLLKYNGFKQKARAIQINVPSSLKTILCLATTRFSMGMRIITTLFITLLVCLSASAQTYSVYFETDKSNIQPEAAVLLDSLLELPGFTEKDTLTITCHCDVRADSAYNYGLSLRRAKSVKTYLQESGASAFFILNAMGKQNPDYPNTEVARFKNRRCDIEMPTNRPVVANEITTDFDVKDWKEGFSMRLEGLEFVGNQALPYADGMPVLYKLYEDLATYSDAEIAIEGHVCCGDDLPLSVARAKAVYDFLVSNGIDSSRLTYSGFSNRRPLVEEVDEISQKHNRRVEIVVLKTPKAAPVAIAIKPHKFVVNLREILWDGKNNIPNYEGNYNLELIAKMIARSKGYRYTLTVYTAKSSQLTTRTTYLNNYFVRKRVSVNKLRVIKGDAVRYPKEDILTLEVNPAH